MLNFLKICQRVWLLILGHRQMFRQFFTLGILFYFVKNT
jgi:hypothetical protein